jgi:bifunctional DNA-binding transcriptional regulator/antitoxin component of YhaV-PrlF toxin-antitoxin module
MKSTMTEKGQTVVPAKIRRDHGLHARTRLEWIDDGRSIRVVPVPEDPIREVKGTTRGLRKRLLEQRAIERSRA